jgi:hypothetical protein
MRALALAAVLAISPSLHASEWHDWHYHSWTHDDGWHGTLVEIDLYGVSQCDYIEIDFVSHLHGARVDGWIDTPAGRTTIGERRVTGSTMVVALPPRPQRLTLRVHNHLRRAPWLAWWRLSCG